LQGDKLFEISNKPIDIVKLKAKLSDKRAGALVVFEGLVRNHNEGSDVGSLEYEAFKELAISEGEIVLAEVKERFEIIDAACSHREGHLQIEDLAVWIGVTSAHRAEAFKACQYIIDEIKLRLPIWKKEHYLSKPAQWVNCQGCYHHSHIEFSEAEYYQVQSNLPSLGLSGQEKLKQSHVLVIGAGGLGCPSLSALARSGVGNITVIDHDKVAINNLHRQNLYTSDDIGKYKVDAAKARLKAMNPFIEITALAQQFDIDNAANLIAKHDVIVDCTDNFKAKFLIHDVAYLQEKPLVQASVYQREGQLQVFMPNQSAGCLRCNWPTIPSDDCVQSCSEAGIMPHTVDVVGSLQALEAIEILLGRTTDNHSKTSLINFPNLDIVKIERTKNDSCPLCSEKATITELKKDNYINLSEFEVMIEDESELKDYVLIDVSAKQSEFSKLKNIKHIPASNNVEFLNLDANKQYLLVCERGVESLRLTRALRLKGLNYYFSLAGGLAVSKIILVKEG